MGGDGKSAALPVRDAELPEPLGIRCNDGEPTGAEMAQRALERVCRGHDGIAGGLFQATDRFPFGRMATQVGRAGAGKAKCREGEFVEVAQCVTEVPQVVLEAGARVGGHAHESGCHDADAGRPQQPDLLLNRGVGLGHADAEHTAAAVFCRPYRHAQSRDATARATLAGTTGAGSATGRASPGTWMVFRSPSTTPRNSSHGA